MHMFISRLFGFEDLAGMRPRSRKHQYFVLNTWKIQLGGVRIWRNGKHSSASIPLGNPVRTISRSFGMTGIDRMVWLLPTTLHLFPLVFSLLITRSQGAGMRYGHTNDWQEVDLYRNRYKAPVQRYEK